MEGEDGFPLLIGHLREYTVSDAFFVLGFPFRETGGKGGIVNLVYNTIPSKPRIINDNMNLPASKLRRLLNQLIDIFRIQHISGYGNGSAACLGDFLDDGLSFCCSVPKQHQ